MHAIDKLHANSLQLMIICHVHFMKSYGYIKLYKLCMISHDRNERQGVLLNVQLAVQKDFSCSLQCTATGIVML